MKGRKIWMPFRRFDAWGAIVLFLFLYFSLVEAVDPVVAVVVVVVGSGKSKK